MAVVTKITWQRATKESERLIDAYYHQHGCWFTKRIERFNRGFRFNSKPDWLLRRINELTLTFYLTAQQLTKED
jgi:hypothetical protein